MSSFSCVMLSHLSLHVFVFLCHVGDGFLVISTVTVVAVFKITHTTVQSIISSTERVDFKVEGLNALAVFGHFSAHIPDSVVVLGSCFLDTGDLLGEVLFGLCFVALAHVLVLFAHVFKKFFQIWSWSHVNLSFLAAASWIP